VLTPFDRLSEREAEVLRALAQGLTVAGIARRSVVSEATVRAQVRSILTKLDVRSQLEAVVAAQRSGWS
jgi:DNA-binding NarL/FixJ family response regulator